MAKFKTENDVGDGWSRWVQPVMNGYRMACCDCNLVHTLEFKVVKVLSLDKGVYTIKDAPEGKFIVHFRARRNNRSTSALRKRKK
jgi:hypothetical protein